LYSWREATVVVLEINRVGPEALGDYREYQRRPKERVKTVQLPEVEA
jgi:hypothetical protein